MRATILALVLLSAAGCGTGASGPVLDCTDEAKFDSSIQAMKAGLTGDDAKAFASAVKRLTISGGIKIIMATPNDAPKPKPFEALKAYHGKTAAEIIAAQRAIDDAQSME